jgi:hypothetical protein
MKTICKAGGCSGSHGYFEKILNIAAVLDFMLSLFSFTELGRLLLTSPQEFLETMAGFALISSLNLFGILR